MDTKNVTVDGKRYRVSTRSYDPAVLDIAGPGLVGGRAVVLTMDAPDFRDRIVAAVRQQKENNRRASDAIQERIRAGTAGLAVREGPPC